MMALAIAGIPTALAYYVAQKKTEHEQRKTLSIGLLLIGVAAIISFIIALIGAPWLANLIGHHEVEPSLRVLAVALLFTPLLAVYRGYYQGKDDAKASSISQMIEQCVRVSCMLLFLWLGIMYNWSDSRIAAGVMWGSSIGAVAALICLLFYQSKGPRLKLHHKEIATEGKVLARIAIPTALAAIVVPMVNVVDAISIPRFMMLAGEHADFVMAEFGRYSRIQPLIQLVSMLLAAFVAGFIPNWVRQGPKEWLGDRLMLLHRLSAMIGAAAALGLFLLASPINFMLYKDAAGLDTFRWLSWTALASSMLAVQAPLLQAAGIRKLPIYLLLIAACSKAILNYMFVPLWGIEGAAIAGIIALFIPAIIGTIALHRATTTMNIIANRKSSGSLEKLRVFSVTLLALVLMLLSINIISELIHYIWPTNWHMRLSHTLEALLTVIVGAIVFGGILIVCKGVTRSELNMLRNQK